MMTAPLTEKELAEAKAALGRARAMVTKRNTLLRLRDAALATAQADLREAQAANEGLRNSLAWAYGTIIVIARDIARWDTILMNEAGPDTIVRVSDSMERTLAKELPPEFTREHPPLLEKMVADAEKNVKKNVRVAPPPEVRG